MGAYNQVFSFVMGTRWDLAPNPHPETLYAHICMQCKATTYTEKKFSQKATVICNSCASTTTQLGDSDPKTQVVWDLPPELLGSLISQAQLRGIFPETYIIGFLEWKTGRELPSIRLYNRADKQIYIVQKHGGAAVSL